MNTTEDNQEIQIITPEPSEDKSTPYFRLVAGVLILAGVLATIFVAAKVNRNGLPGNIGQDKKADIAKIQSFSSPEEFKQYLSESQSVNSINTFGFGGGIARSGGAEMISLAAPVADMTKEESALKPNRVSETNIQVTGVDEPDIVKTDGTNIFYSYPFGPEPLMLKDDTVSASEIIAPDSMPINNSGTKIISAFPPAVLKETSSINSTGNLLYKDNTLVIVEGDTLTGINITDKASPKESWKVGLDDHYIVSTRLIGDTIYVVTQKSVNYDSPCPIPLATVGSQSIQIPCTRVYHPVAPVASTTTYQVFSINVGNGTIGSSASFVGDAGSTVVYVSPANIYVTYTGILDPTPILIEFFTKDGSNILGSSTTQKIRSLSTLNISSRAKAVELQIIIEDYLNTTSADDRRKLENNVQNKLQDFAQSRIRDFQTTGIAKLKIDDLNVSATGTTPGRPLNQYSLDEHNGNLRIATTIDASWVASTQSTNDLYVLDESLKTIGSVQDLGKEEQIFSVRFVGNKGYLVTFKQTDPFFVLDLGNPKDPKVTGELKIPGFSSYLHPLDDNTILGIGREGNNVKVSMFDVSDPKNPTESAKYTLDEYWSEAGDNPHAFLQDSKHKAFFLPAGQSGYIMSYANNELILERVVSGTNAQRAIFLNDYLYIIGSEKIVALNESDWSNAGELAF